MGHCRTGQGTAPLGHVGEVHQCPVAEAQGDVQIPQADVHIDAQHPLPSRARQEATPPVTEVLPVPPFPEVTAMTIPWNSSYLTKISLSQILGSSMFFL